MATTAILVLLFGHFFADFVCQPDWMALFKWKSNKALASHIGVYMLGLLAFTWLFLFSASDFETWTWVVYWVLFNGFCHFITDYVTSRDMHDLWFEKDYRMFFIYIGLDQFFHYAVLFVSYSILTNFII